MKKIALFSAAFAVTFGLAAASDGLAWTKIRRYSAFYCNGSTSVANGADGIAVTPAASSTIFCPHASSNDFALDDVQNVDVSINNYYTGSYPTVVPASVRACVSWSYNDGGGSQFGAQCGNPKSASASVLGGQTIELQQGGTDELSAWVDRPFGFAYLAINSGVALVGGGGPVLPTPVTATAVTGYRVYD